MAKTYTASCGKPDCPWQLITVDEDEACDAADHHEDCAGEHMTFVTTSPPR